MWGWRDPGGSVAVCLQQRALHPQPPHPALRYHLRSAQTQSCLPAVCWQQKQSTFRHSGLGGRRHTQAVSDHFGFYLAASWLPGMFTFGLPSRSSRLSLLLQAQLPPCCFTCWLTAHNDPRLLWVLLSFAEQNFQISILCHSYLHY